MIKFIIELCLYCGEYIYIFVCVCLLVFRNFYLDLIFKIVKIKLLSVILGIYLLVYKISFYLRCF